MKKIFIFLAVLLFATSAYADIVDNGAATDSIAFDFVVWDSTGNDLVALASGDSVWLIVKYPNGQLAFKDSTDFNDTEIVSEASSDFTVYSWRDATQDVDGTPVYGGVYKWNIIVKDLTGSANKSKSSGEFSLLPNYIDMYNGTGYTGGTNLLKTNVSQVVSDANAAESLLTWLTGSTTLYEQLTITDAEVTNIVDTVNAVLDTLQAGFASQSAVGDTNQVDLTNYDGATPLVASDNIGINWGDISNPTTTQNLTQTTIDSVREVGFVSGDTSPTNWGNMWISGTPGQGYVRLEAQALADVADEIWDEVLTGGTHNVPSSAGRRLRQLETGQVLLTGTINTANDSTATLGLSGAYPDEFFEHTWLVVTVGPDSVQIRQINHYIGATDSVEMAPAEAWVIVPANGDEWEIVAATGTHVVDMHAPVLGQIRDTIWTDRVITLAQFDTASVSAYYDFGIWLDDGAGNTNTTVGVDGTIANPVSTIAAARILADSMGLQKYYLINNSSFTLAATYEDWHFIGVGESNQINFGSQDIDNSHFEHLMVTGTQGGTGLIWLTECYLNATDSLECVARDSWFSDTLSVRASSNIVFDQCYSAVAGNNTPGMDFNSAGGTVNVSVRHYSGGLALFNMTSDHTISYESDGQLVIDASCTSANITARGNMTITDNGTTTALTKDAVYNQAELQDHILGADSATFDVVNTFASTGYQQGAASGITVDQIWEYDTTNISGANAVGTMLKDTSAYQGAASGLTVASIVDSLMKHPVANDTTTGTTIFADFVYNSGDTSLWLSNGEIVVQDTLDNGDTIAVMPNHWVGADSTAYQGAGADATPSQWDAVDSAIIYGLVWSDAGDTTKNINNVDGKVSGDVDGSVVGSVGSISSITFPTNFEDLSISVTNGEVKILSSDSITTVLGNVNGSVEGDVKGNVDGSVGWIANYDSILFDMFNFDMDDSTSVFLQDKFYWYIRFSKINSDSLLIVTRPPEIWTASDSLIVYNIGAQLGADSSYGGGTATIPDSLLGIVPRVDTLVSRQDSLRLAIGWGGSSPVWDSLGPNLHDKVGTFSGVNNSIRVWLDSLRLSIGWGGSSPVWDSVTTNIHDKMGTYAGTAGDNNNIKDDIAAISVGSGSGSNACSIYVYDNGNDEYIQGANVRLQSSGGTNYYFPATDANGLAVFALDDGTFYGYATISDYTQDVIPDTFTFTADYNDTLLVTTRSTPATPADTGYCNVYVDTWGISYGDTIEGAELTITPIIKGNLQWKLSSGRIILPKEITVKTDSTGRAIAQILKTHLVTNPKGDSLKYDFTVDAERYFKYKATKRIVPDSGSWRIE